MRFLSAIGSDNHSRRVWDLLEVSSERFERAGSGCPRTDGEDPTFRDLPRRRAGFSWAFVVGCPSADGNTTDAVQRVSVGLPLVAVVWVFVLFLLPLLPRSVWSCPWPLQGFFPCCTCLFRVATVGSRMQFLTCQQVRSGDPGATIHKESMWTAGTDPRTGPRFSLCQVSLPCRIDSLLLLHLGLPVAWFGTSGMYWVLFFVNILTAFVLFSSGAFHWLRWLGGPQVQQPIDNFGRSAF